MMMQDDSSQGYSRADWSSPRQSGRAIVTIAARRALAAALWLTTLYAVCLTVGRSGAYGLVTEAQNLIALYGVLRAAIYTIEARQAIRRRGLTALFRRNGRMHGQ